MSDIYESASEYIPLYVTEMHMAYAVEHLYAYWMIDAENRIKAAQGADVCAEQSHSFTISWMAPIIVWGNRLNNRQITH